MRLIFLVLIVAWLLGASAAEAGTLTAPTPSQHAVSATGANTLDLEQFQYQKYLEAEKLKVERLKAWLTGGSILFPLALGVLTLFSQARTANKLKDRDAKDAFELKAAEILFSTDSTVGTRNRARALTTLFPGRFPSNFGDAFEPTQFGGPRYEAKIEVFRAACEKVKTPEEVYGIWHAIFPADQWIKPLVVDERTSPADAA